MDKKTYVTRLKKMLNRYADTSCSHCPASRWYKPDTNMFGFTKEDCKMCQSFVGLKFKWEDKGFRIMVGCPCYRPNPERAIPRALKYTALYEEKHGEIKL